MDLEHAVQKHAEWKLRFRSAIARHETLDAASIGRDDCCDLGKWLHGEARRRFGSLQSHATCLSRHAAFHAEAGKVAQAVNARHYDTAEALMDADSGYVAASTAVGVAILRLKKEAGL
jgi:methyl-accepting chemotaxis protein